MKTIITIATLSLLALASCGETEAEKNYRIARERALKSEAKVDSIRRANAIEVVIINR